MLKAFGKLPNEAERLRISEQSHLLGTNRITTGQYIEQLGNILKVASLPTVKQFEDATIEVTNPPTPEMIDLVSRVRKSGVKVSLLSDMYMFEVKLTKPWGRYDGFDYVSLSAEAGMTKSDPNFFRQTLDYFQISASDALFVDDKQSNIETAAGLGIHTLLADNTMYPDAPSLTQIIYQQLSLKQVIN